MPVIHRQEPEVLPLILNTASRIHGWEGAQQARGAAGIEVFHFSAMNSPHLDAILL